MPMADARLTGTGRESLVNCWHVGGALAVCEGAARTARRMEFPSLTKVKYVARQTRAPRRKQGDEKRLVPMAFLAMACHNSLSTHMG